MGKKFINIIKMIKSNKRYKYTIIVTIMLLFISTIGYSLSFFNKNNSMLVANIRVNDLSFNLTTNSGESDDRVLKLAANSSEVFNVNILSLNSVDVKYELIYKICTDVNCTSYYDDVPDGIQIGLNKKKTKSASGTIVGGTNNSSLVGLMTINTTSTDYYILLDLNAGYGWNELTLVDLFSRIHVGDVNTEVVAYVDGIKSSTYPTSCNYVAKLVGIVDGSEVELTNSYITCNRDTNKWKTVVEGFADKIIVNFTYLQGMPVFTYTGKYETVNTDTLDWKIKFLTSGTLTFPEEVPTLDVFLVGGGGAGAGWAESSYYGAGGGGGYTNTIRAINVLSETEYKIVIGPGGSTVHAAGSESTAFGYKAAGGKGAYKNVGGNGGSGGASGSGSTNNNPLGGTDGYNGNAASTSYTAGKGQREVPGPNGETGSTREFGEESGNLYSSGGNGAASNTSTANVDNTGNGGKGANYGNKYQNGSSGIVIIRSHVE